MNENVWQALLFSAIAGLSTGIGSLIALFAKKSNKTFLSVSLGFSAGVMIYVCFAELFKNSQEMLAASFGQVKGAIFFGCFAVLRHCGSHADRGAFARKGKKGVWRGDLR